MPRCGSTCSRVCKAKQIELICAPKRIGPRRSRRFPCKSATSESAVKRAKVPIMDPSGRRLRLCGSWERRPCPPLWQYFSRLRRKALDRMCAPKRVGPRRSSRLPCKSATSEGAVEGAKGADHGPPVASGCVCAGAGSGGHAPLWQYLAMIAFFDPAREPSRTWPATAMPPSWQCRSGLRERLLLNTSRGCQHL